MVSAASGAVAAGVAAVAGAPWPLTALAGWNSAALVFLVLVWVTVWRFSPAATAAMSTREDASRPVSNLIVLIASTASLTGVLFGMRLANRSTGGLRFWLTAAVIGCVVCSWTVVHTVYTLHYAHLFHRKPTGGILFPGDEPPDYVDFAYVSFTLGMTFQVSDNKITARDIRRAALFHCLLSYLFGTAIIATTINLVATLVS